MSNSPDLSVISLSPALLATQMKFLDVDSDELHWNPDRPPSPSAKEATIITEDASTGTTAVTAAPSCRSRGASMSLNDIVTSRRASTDSGTPWGYLRAARRVSLPVTSADRLTPYMSVTLTPPPERDLDFTAPIDAIQARFAESVPRSVLSSQSSPSLPPLPGQVSTIIDGESAQLLPEHAIAPNHSGSSQQTRPSARRLSVSVAPLYPLTAGTGTLEITSTADKMLDDFDETSQNRANETATSFDDDDEDTPIFPNCEGGNACPIPLPPIRFVQSEFNSRRSSLALDFSRRSSIVSPPNGSVPSPRQTTHGTSTPVFPELSSSKKTSFFTYVAYFSILILLAALIGQTVTPFTA